MGTVDLEDAEIVGRRKSPKEVVKESLITGAAIILPLAVTLLVLSFVIGFLSSNLRPVSSQLVNYVPLNDVIVVEAVTILALLVLTLLIGFVAEFTTRGGLLGGQFDRFMQAIPGLGSVYTSFNEMSELLLDSDTDSFQDVKLVEYPGQGSYTVAFKTAETPEVLEEDTGHPNMVTLFMPMAPNPVMGGFVIHVSTDRVVDTDLTVEEGLRSIVTSGVAIGEENAEMRGLSEEQMEELGRIRRVEDGNQPESTGGVADRTHRERYDRAVDAEHSETPERIERRADRETGDRSTPADIERGDGTIGDTEGRPAESRRRDERTRGTTPEAPAEVGAGSSVDGSAGATDDSGSAAGTDAEDWIPDEFVDDSADGDGAAAKDDGTDERTGGDGGRGQ